MQKKGTGQERREKIQKILGATEEEDFTVVRWVKPEEPPQEGTYILVKESDPDEGIVCSQGAYENGKFWYAPDADVEIPSSRIIGWSYLPYDTRLDSLGNVKLC